MTSDMQSVLDRMDIPFFQKVMDHVAVHPEEFDMSVWVRRDHCGTTACLAGTVALLSGAELNFRLLGNEAARLTSGECVDDYAQRVLGLTDDEAFHLFIDCAAMDLDQVLAEVKKMTLGLVS